MENAPFAEFERGDIVGIWSEGEGKLINTFLIRDKKDGKYFGCPNISESSAVENFNTWIQELESPYKYLKKCSVKLD